MSITYGRPGVGAWFRTFRPRPLARQRLVCFPHAGGTATAFRELADLAASIAALADQLAGGLIPLFDRPVALFGHSMGSTVAFEVARRVQRTHPGALVRLFASARKSAVGLRAARAGPGG